MHGCVVKMSCLFGPSSCGRKGLVYDRARRGWLCRDHTKERLCEFCHAERGWARISYQRHGMACDAWLCLSCAGCSMRHNQNG